MQNAWEQQGSELHPSHAAGVRAWRARIVSSQQPAGGCVASTPLCRCNTHHAGLTSKLGAAAICVLHATLHGCALHGAPTSIDEYTTSGALHRSCRGWACYFQPVSACQNATLAPGQAVRTISTDQRHLLHQFKVVANRTGLASEMLIMATCMAWATRPLPLLSRTELALTRRLDSISGGEPSGGGEASGDGASGGEPDGEERVGLSRCVGAHLRRGDKKSADRHVPDLEERKGVAYHLSAESIWRW